MGRKHRGGSQGEGLEEAWCLGRKEVEDKISWMCSLLLSGKCYLRVDGLLRDTAPDLEDLGQPT